MKLETICAKIASTILLLEVIIAIITSVFNILPYDGFTIFMCNLMLLAFTTGVFMIIWSIYSSVIYWKMDIKRYWCDEFIMFIFGTVLILIAESGFLSGILGIDQYYTLGIPVAILVICWLIYGIVGIWTNMNKKSD